MKHPSVSASYAELLRDKERRSMHWAKSNKMQKTIKEFDRKNEYIEIVEQLFATNAIDEEEADFLRKFVTAS